MKVNSGVEYKKSFKLIRNVSVYEIKHENNFVNFKNVRNFNNSELKINY